MGTELENEDQDLIAKFLQGEASEEEVYKLKNWLTASPENRKRFDKENELWQQVSICSGIGEEQIESAWNQLSSKLKINGKYGSSIAVIRNINYRILVAAAAIACLIAIGSLTLWVTGRSSLMKTALSSTIISTSDGEKSHICLPDSSKITMNSGSTLIYSGAFNIKDRCVILDGEAYFDIKTNPDKPFKVRTGKMQVIATGTRFNVLSFDDENRVETTLESGQVYVEIEGKTPLKLESGEQVVFLKKSGDIQICEVYTETYTSWKENMLRLNDTPFEEALRRIARKYNVRFEITNTGLYDLKYTATFIDETIEDVMEMLKVISPIDYKIYYQTTANDIKYQKPKIVIRKRKTQS